MTINISLEVWKLGPTVTLMDRHLVREPLRHNIVAQRMKNER